MFSGTWNARDLGGLRTADGRTVRSELVFRSASLDDLDDNGRQALRERGITDVFDLREPAEAASTSGGTVLPESIRLHRNPFGFDASTRATRDELREIADDPRRFMIRTYTTFSPLPGTRAAIGSVIRTLANRSGGPQPRILVHCAAGKDRTGWLIALLLETLAVTPEDVLHDYLASNSAAEELMRRTGAGGGSVDLDLYGVRHEYLVEARKAVEYRHPSLADYLLACGVTRNDVFRLQQAVLV